jgi:SPP1 gp7 family putative phage head morphogenesis protein
MTSSKYFEKRKLDDAKAMINKTEDFINKEIEANFKQALKDIEKELNIAYKKYADDNNLTLEQAKQRVYTKEYGRISRLTQMQMQIEDRLIKMYETQQVNIYEHLYKTYEDSYLKSFYDIGDSTGFELNFTLPHDKAIHNAIMSDWSGENFSKRIWKHEKKTFEAMKQSVIKGITKGSGVEKIVRDLRKNIDVSKSNARRLVRTESNYAFNKGSLDAYVESGIVEKYRFLATLDHRVSVVCASLDGQVFKIDKAEIALNYPPMHPNCRSTTVAEFDDYKLKNRRYNFGDKESDSKGVGAYESYNDWIKTMSKENKARLELNKNKFVNSKRDRVLFDKYKKLSKNNKLTFDEFQNSKYSDKKEYEQLKKEFQEKNKINKFKNDIKNGKIKTKVNKDKQARHILGTKEYESRLERDKKKDTAPSYFYKDVDIQKLVDKHAGLGGINFKRNPTYPEEIIKTSKTIGEYYNENDEKYYETNTFKIQYSKKDVHVFPTKERS